MIINRDLLIGEKRDRFYLDVLTCDGEGNLTDPANVAYVISRLIEVAEEETDHAVKSTYAGLAVLLSWHLNYHLMPVGHYILSSILDEADSNQTTNLARQVINSGLDPRTARIKMLAVPL